MNSCLCCFVLLLLYIHILGLVNYLLFLDVLFIQTHWNKALENQVHLANIEILKILTSDTTDYSYRLTLIQFIYLLFTYLMNN